MSRKTTKGGKAKPVSSAHTRRVWREQRERRKARAADGSTASAVVQRSAPVTTKRDRETAAETVVRTADGTAVAGAAKRNGKSAAVSVEPTVVPAVAPAGVPVPPLRMSLARACWGGLLCLGLLGLLMGQYAVLREVLTYLQPGSLDVWPRTLGAAGAIGLLAGETIVGCLFGVAIGIERTSESVDRMERGSRAAYAWILGVLLLGFATVEAGLAAVRVDMAEEVHVAAATQTVTQAIAQMVVPTGMGPRTTEAWGKAQVALLQAEAAISAKQAQAATAAAAQSSEHHRMKNTAVQVGLALVLSLAVAACSVVVGDFLHALLAIPGGIVALLRRKPPGDTS